MVLMKCRGESWRPKSGALRTKVAITPTRIAQSEAPEDVESQRRPSTVGVRKSMGTAKSRRTT
jgi:hypothetical protein